MPTSTSAARLVLASVAGFVAGALGVAVAGSTLDALRVAIDPALVLVIFGLALFGPAILVARAVLSRGAPTAVPAEASGSAPSSMEAPVETAQTQKAPELDDVARAIALAQAPPAESKTSPLLVATLSLGAFVLFDRGTNTLRLLVLLVLVLLFHEAGHLAGMRLFGYRDLRMLFVPFVGALASGKKSGAPGWQQAVVLLLGPLPGLVLSLVVLCTSSRGIGRDFATQLLLINGFNLLPLVPLDGGRFMQQLFSRHPRVQAAFSATSLVAFGGLFVALGDWVLVAVAAFFLALVPLQLRVATEGAAVRAAWGAVPPLSELSDDAARNLYVRVRSLSKTPSPKPPLIASLMRQVHERAATEPVSPPLTLTLLFVYGGGFVLLLADLVLLARHHP